MLAMTSRVNCAPPDVPCQHQMAELSICMHACMVDVLARISQKNKMVVARR